MNYYPNLNNDYIGATGEHIITDYINLSSNNNFIFTSNVNSNLNKRIDNINLETSNISSNISSNYTQILRNQTWAVNNTNSNHLINYNYNDYTLYGAIHTNIFIDANQNSKIIFRPRYNNQAIQHKTEIRSDGKLYVYLEGNLVPPIFPTWYCLNEELQNIFVVNTGQDIAISTITAQVAEIFTTLLQHGIKLQALSILDTATGSYTIISAQLDNYATWQYVVGGIVATIGVAGLYTTAVANRAGNLADMINSSFVSSNALL